MVLPGSELRVVRRDHASVDLTVEFRMRRSLIGLCLASGGSVEILDPPELREDARTAARSALAVLDRPPKA